MSKTFLSKIIVWGCILTVGFTSMPIYASTEIDENKSVEAIQDDKKINWLKLSWKTFASAVDYFWHPNEKSVSNRLEDYVSSGRFDFNHEDNDYAATLSHDVAIQSDSTGIELVGQRPGIDFAAKIAVTIYDDNSDYVTSKTLEDDQRFQYKLDSPSDGEEWNIAFTSTDKKPWNCWIFEQHKERRNKEGYIENDDFIIKDNENFYVKFNEVPAIRSISQYITMQELVEELTDPVNGYYVDNFTSYDVGDTIRFSDVIYDLAYDDERDCTEVSFIGDNDEPIIWLFKGDITSQYAVGDILKLNFEVIVKDKIGDITFETLDYIEEISKNNIPEISMYTE